MGRHSESTLLGPNPAKSSGRRSYKLVLLAILLGIGLYSSRLCIRGHVKKKLSWRDLPVGSVEWWACTDYAEGVECGHIIVPTDYHNASAGTTKIALNRLKASQGSKKGTILLNPGGPGGPGTRMLATTDLTHLLGHTYDIVGVDPRGIGGTEPKVNCFGGRDKMLLFTRNTVFDRSFDLGPNLTDPQLRENLLRQQRELDTIYKTGFELCGKVMGDQLRYMGTTTVARDYDFITTILEGPDSLINYYGGSYGSVLAQYLVNMFPGRIGRVSIDGIVDAVSWSSQPPYKWYHQWVQDSEATYDMFLNMCTEAGPSDCALAEISSDPSVLKTRIEEFFNDLYLQPIPVPHSSRPGILTAGLARKYLGIILDIPTAWKQAAVDLTKALLTKDASGMLENHWDRYQDFERSAVSCNDQDSKYLHYNPPSDEDIVDELLHISKTSTKFVWGVMTAEPDSGCQHWYPNVPEPPERFTGPWNHTLANTILVLSNTADPITPLDSAKKVSGLLGSSARLVIQNGPGHGTALFESLCIAKIVRSYFDHGTLPIENTVCELDKLPFDGEVDWTAKGHNPEDVVLLQYLNSYERLADVHTRFNL